MQALLLSNSGNNQINNRKWPEDALRAIPSPQKRPSRSFKNVLTCSPLSFSAFFHVQWHGSNLDLATVCKNNDNKLYKLCVHSVETHAWHQRSVHNSQDSAGTWFCLIHKADRWRVEAESRTYMVSRDIRLFFQIPPQQSLWNLFPPGWSCGGSQFSF